MAQGNAGLIGLKKDPADGEAQKCIEAQAGGNAEAVCNDDGTGEVAGAKPIKVIKKENRPRRPSSRPTEGEGGGEGQFQKLFATAIGTSLPTNSLPQLHRR